MDARAKPFDRRASLLATISIVALVAGAVNCSSSASPTGQPIATQTTVAEAAQMLGPANVATGSPIKIGFVLDGKTDTLDQSSAIDAAKATVAYANEHLNGINGHVIELDVCETGLTPSGATTCGVRMVTDKVVAVTSPGSGQDEALFAAIKGSGIPYLTLLSANTDILLSSDAFLLQNPTGQIAAIAKLAKDRGAKKVAFVPIDVPAATAPLAALAGPIFQKADVDFQLVPISLSIADPSAPIQQAISGGADLFATFGSDEFAGSVVKTLKQLGFEGTVALGVGNLESSTAESLPGGAAGIVSFSGFDTDPSHGDVRLFNAIMATYAPDATINSISPYGFSPPLALIRALTGVDAAVDAPSVAAALSSMTKAVPLPLQDSLTFQCGARLVAVLPSACVKGLNEWTLDANGRPKDIHAVDLSGLQ